MQIFRSEKKNFNSFRLNTAYTRCPFVRHSFTVGMYIGTVEDTFRIKANCDERTLCSLCSISMRSIKFCETKILFLDFGGIIIMLYQSFEMIGTKVFEISESVNTKS